MLQTEEDLPSPSQEKSLFWLFPPLPETNENAMTTAEEADLTQIIGPVEGHFSGAALITTGAGVVEIEKTFRLTIFLKAVKNRKDIFIHRC